MSWSKGEWRHVCSDIRYLLDIEVVAATLAEEDAGTVNGHHPEDAVIVLHVGDHHDVILQQQPHI